MTPHSDQLLSDKFSNKSSIGIQLTVTACEGGPLPAGPELMASCTSEPAEGKRDAGVAAAVHPAASGSPGNCKRGCVRTAPWLTCPICSGIARDADGTRRGFPSPGDVISLRPDKGGGATGGGRFKRCLGRTKRGGDAPAGEERPSA